MKAVTNWDKVPLFVDLAYVSAVIGICTETLKKMARSGEFPACKYGRQWRVEKSDWQAFNENQKVKNERKTNGNTSDFNNRIV